MGDMRNIEIVPYNPRWPEMFQTEAEKISVVFGVELVAIHHIGSTSVSGLSAKPIIDIMPVVCDIEQVDQFNLAMIELEYESRGEYGIAGRGYFSKEGDVHRTHHVHIFQEDNEEVTRHLIFRDYLIAHPYVAQQYAALKIEVAKQHPHDIYGYMDGKDAFIREAIPQAHQWRAEQKENP